MRRLLYISLICMLLLPFAPAPAEARTPLLRDLSASYAREEILTLVSAGILHGYGDGTFRPEFPVSRQEMAVLLTSALRLKETSVSVPFKDTAKWAADSVSMLRESGIARGTGEDLFHAERPVKREELAVWAVRSLRVFDPPARLKSEPLFRDLDSASGYARSSIELAGAIGLMQGNRQRTFAPGRFVTRQEAALVAYRLHYGLEEYRTRAVQLLDPGKETGVEQPQNSPLPAAEPPRTPVSEVSAQPRPDIPVTVPPVVPEPRPDVPVTVPPVVTEPRPDVPVTVPPVVPEPRPDVPVPVPPVVTEPEPDIPAVTPPSTVYAKIASAALADEAPPSSYEPNPDEWKLDYTLRGEDGNILPAEDLAPDVQVRFADPAGIFGSDGTVARPERLPAPENEVTVQMAVYSKLAASSFEQTFRLRVRPVPEVSSYFAISILLDSDGNGQNGTTVEEMQRLRTQLEKLSPDRPIRVTWALNSNFVFWESNRAALAEVRRFVHDYGNEVGIAISYPNDNFNGVQWQQTIGEWLYMYRYNGFGDIHRSGEAADVQAMLTSFREGGYAQDLPTSLTSFGVNPQQAEWLSQTFGIHAFMGWPATQVNVGQLSGEGSPLMPYWASVHNPIVPARSQADNAGFVILNTSTIDPIGSRYTEGSSRWTLNPGDPYVAEHTAQPQLHTAAQYLDNPYRGRNTLNYLSLVLDANSVLRNGNLSANWQSFIDGMPRHFELTVTGANELAGLYEQAAGTGNEDSEFTLEFRGAGYMTRIDDKDSPANVRYLWTETQDERIILRREDGEDAWRIIDFTDYARGPVSDLPYTNGQGAKVDVSYITGRNYKLAPEAPLTEVEKVRIASRLADLHMGDIVLYE